MAPAWAPSPNDLIPAHLRKMKDSRAAEARLTSDKIFGIHVV